MHTMRCDRGTRVAVPGSSLLMPVGKKDQVVLLKRISCSNLVLGIQTARESGSRCSGANRKRLLVRQGIYSMSRRKDGTLLARSESFISGVQAGRCCKKRFSFENIQRPSTANGLLLCTVLCRLVECAVSPGAQEDMVSVCFLTSYQDTSADQCCCFGFVPYPETVLHAVAFSLGTNSPIECLQCYLTQFCFR